VYHRERDEPPRPPTPRPAAARCRALTLLLAVAIFAVDLQIPLCAPGRRAVSPIVLRALAFAGSRQCVLWALGCSALTLMGCALSPNPEERSSGRRPTARWRSRHLGHARRGRRLAARRARPGRPAAARRIIDSALDAVIGVDTSQRIVSSTGRPRRPSGARRDVVGQPLGS
jgi:hypothetical protein